MRRLDWRYYKILLRRMALTEAVERRWRIGAPMRKRLEALERAQGV